MTDLFSDREWFTVVAKPGKSEEVHRRYLEQGYRSFLPMCLRDRECGRGRVETVARPLFDRYQFVGVHTEQPFGPILHTIGVAFLVRGAGGIPLRVSPLVLRRVQARCDADGGMVDLRRPRKLVDTAPDAPLADWQPGQALEVIDGPFRSFAASLLEWADKRHQMAVVMVELFGRPMRMEVPVSGLRPSGGERRVA